MKNHLALGAIAILLGTTVVNAAKVRYTLSDPGSTFEGMALGEQGQIVGRANFSGQLHAAIFANGAIVDYGVITGGSQALINAITPDGTFAIGTGDIAGGALKTFIVDLADPTNKSALSTTGNYAAINNALQLGGSATFGMATHAARFDYPGGTENDLGALPGGTSSVGVAINASNTIVGWSEVNGSLSHAFIQSGAAMNDIGTLGGSTSSAAAVNDADLVVGVSRDASNKIQPFLYSAGTGIQKLQPFSGSAISGDAVDINNHNDILGTADFSDNTTKIFVLSGNETIDVNASTVLPAGYELRDPMSLNDGGQILVTVKAPDSQFLRAALLTPTVVPAPVVLTKKKKITTNKAAINLVGTTSGETDSVSYRVGKGPVKTARGVQSWKIKVKLKPGKNLVTITASGYGGSSAPVKITIRRN
jgi:probable HAF family extracellular repeat protein